MDDEVEVEIEGNDELKAFMPSGFGKQDRRANVAAQIDQAKRAVMQSKPVREKREDSDKDSDDDDDDDSEDEEDEFPVSHELVIKTHEKAVTTTSIDPAGMRLITSSSDCTVNFHDFTSMSATTIRAFRSIDPTFTKQSSNNETHPVHQVLFNPISPSHVLAITAFPQPKLLNRDGEVVSTFVKGDMYLRDMHNTKGHIAAVTSADWHPSQKEICVTAGSDSTLRIWDINNPRTQKEVIVHKSKAAGAAGRSRVTAVAWGAPAQGGEPILVGAAYDGSLTMWSGNGPFNRPSAEIQNAHANDTWTSGLDISPDGRLVVTRGGDDTVKIWDTRKFKQPVNSVSHPSTASQYPSSNIRFSPNASSIITGSPTGDLHILNPATLRPELVTAVTPGSPLITVLWHEKLNQIITGSANAETHVLFNPATSTGGAITVLSKTPKRRHIDDDPNRTMDMSQGFSGDSIVNPGASRGPRNPNVGLTASGRPRDPRRPHVPATTPFAKSQPDERHIDSLPGTAMRDEDPREALLKYANTNDKDRIYTAAWAETQPTTIYAELSEDDEEEEGPEKKKAKR